MPSGTALAQNAPTTLRQVLILQRRPSKPVVASVVRGPLPAGTARVAEVDGEILAALSLGDGIALADPFRPTAALLRLLDLRAAQLRGTGRRRAWRPRFRPLRPARVE